LTAAAVAALEPLVGTALVGLVALAVQVQRQVLLEQVLLVPVVAVVVEDQLAALAVLEAAVLAGRVVLELLVQRIPAAVVAAVREMSQATAVRVL